MEDHKRKLNRERDNNKQLDSDIAGEERSLARIRENLAKLDSEKDNLNGEVAILRN